MEKDEAEACQEAAAEVEAVGPIEDAAPEVETIGPIEDAPEVEVVGHIEDDTAKEPVEVAADGVCLLFHFGSLEAEEMAERLKKYPHEVWYR
jgi:RNA-splicing ligase RtcB